MFGRKDIGVETGGGGEGLREAGSSERRRTRWGGEDAESGVGGVVLRGAGRSRAGRR